MSIAQMRRIIADCKEIGLKSYAMSYRQLGIPTISVGSFNYKFIIPVNPQAEIAESERFSQAGFNCRWETEKIGTYKSWICEKILVFEF
jgi:hypothetical protein